MFHLRTQFENYNLHEKCSYSALHTQQHSNPSSSLIDRKALADTVDEQQDLRTAEKNLRPLRRMRRRNSMQLDRSSIFFYLFREKKCDFMSSWLRFLNDDFFVLLLCRLICWLSRFFSLGRETAVNAEDESWNSIMTNTERRRTNERKFVFCYGITDQRRRRWIKSIFYFSSLNASKLFFPSQQFSSIQWKVAPLPAQMKGFRRWNFAFAAATADDDE